MRNADSRELARNIQRHVPKADKPGPTVSREVVAEKPRASRRLG
jgi:hypothetical protein